MFKTLQKLTALFVLFCSFSVAADNPLSAQQLLQEMSNAQEKQNYEFTFVKTGQIGVDTYLYRHLYRQGKSIAQLISLNGVKREIIRRDNLVSYFQTNSQPFTIHSKHIIDELPSLWFADITKLSPHYNFIDMGKNRVANRLARTIRIAPKDDFRNQYVVFIDENTHLLLRTDLLDRHGNLLEQFQMVTLADLDNDSKFMDYVNGIQYPPLVIEDDEQQKISGWTLTWLPAGFQLISEHIQTDENKQQIESRLYSDGLFSFTVFVAEQILPEQAESDWQLPPNTVYSSNIGNKEVTVIGQIPNPVAKRIAQEIQFNQ